MRPGQLYRHKHIGHGCPYYYVYIITNRSKRTLYIGVTNSLKDRLLQHRENARTEKTWAGRYQCYLLVYYEEFKYIDKAIAREKQLKGWNRKKKEWLVSLKNPDWRFLNHQFE